MERRQVIGRDTIAAPDYLVRRGILKLLAIKDSDIRILTLEQCRDAVDKGLHAGGAFSAVIPLVSLYYGGFLTPDIVEPTRRGPGPIRAQQGPRGSRARLHLCRPRLLRPRGAEEFALLPQHSERPSGPAAARRSLGHRPDGTRSLRAQGFAIAGRTSPRFDCYCLCGDGELQEGTIWEGVMYGGQNHLDNLCVMVDQNHGQLDVYNRTVFPMPDLGAVFQAFGWNAHTVDATEFDCGVRGARKLQIRGAQRQAYGDCMPVRPRGRAPFPIS